MVSQQSRLQQVGPTSASVEWSTPLIGHVNVGDAERLCSLAGGGLLAWIGLREGGILGTGLALVGGSLMVRGLTGHCPIYAARGMDTRGQHSPQASMAAGRGVKVVEAIVVNASAEKLFNVWRDFENLPRFMRHLVRVEDNGKLSHWFAHGPAGIEVSWDAEIIAEDPGRMIGWRSLPGSQVDTAGSVHFTPLSAGRGTEVRVTLKYDPPGGKVGAWLAWMFGQEPGRQVRDDLARFRELIESGEISVAERRPARRF